MPRRQRKEPETRHGVTLGQAVELLTDKGRTWRHWTDHERASDAD
jgi:hypothetical protein